MPPGPLVAAAVAALGTGLDCLQTDLVSGRWSDTLSSLKSKLERLTCGSHENLPWLREHNGTSDTDHRPGGEISGKLTL